MRMLVIDGMNLLIRNFVVVPTTDVNGNSIGGITGFIKSLKTLVADTKPDRIVVAWDGEGGSRRRRGIFADYKAGRKVRLNRVEDLETQDESFKSFGGQLKKLEKILDCLGVLQVRADDVEADDVIAFICKYVSPEDDKVVVSSDMDLIQLVDSKTTIYSPSKKKFISSPEVKESTGVLPENYIYIKALKGDRSDNVSGVGGIAEKTAVKLFPFLAERLTSLDEIRQHSVANEGSSPKYSSILKNWQRVVENVKLMQLSSPIISPQTAGNIRQIVREKKPKFMFTEYRMQLILNGIQSISEDVLTVFQGFKFRAEKAQ